MPLMSKPSGTIVSHTVRGYHNQVDRFTIYACPDCLFRVGSIGGSVKKRTLLVAINKHKTECWLFRLSLAVQQKII